MALKKIQDDFRNKSGVSDFQSEEDVVNYIKSIRQIPV